MLRTLIAQEKRASTKDGRWFSVRIMPYRTLENVIDGVVITFTDSSAAQAMEEALVAQTEQIQQMTDALPLLSWTSRPDGRYEKLNARWTEYTGIPAAEQLGFAWLEQVHPDDRERVRDAWRAAIKLGTPFDQQLRIRGASGDYRQFRSRAIPVRDWRGALLKWYGTNIALDDATTSMRVSPARD